MPAWIECDKCGIEFRDKPGRVRCPECGARIPNDDHDEREDDEDFEAPIRRKSGKSKPKNKNLLFAFIGVGVLAVALLVILLFVFLGGAKAKPSLVTIANFQKLNAGMTQNETEKVLGGSQSSALSDLQAELGRAGAGLDGQMIEGLMTMFSGPGNWRRWDGVNGDVKVWGLFTEPFGGGRVRLSYSFALEKLPGGGYRPHRGVQTLGGMFGLPFQPGPNVPGFANPNMPGLPQPGFPGGFPK